MKKWWKTSIKGIVAGAFVASAAVIAVPVVATSKSTSTKLNNNISNATEYTYIPITLADPTDTTGYNCSTIVADKTGTGATGYKNISPLDYHTTDTLGTIASSQTSSNHRSQLFLTSAAKNADIGTGKNTAKGFDDPVNGYVTLTSANQPTGSDGTLRWQIPVKTDEAVKNTLKLNEKDKKTGSFTFKELGAYDKMYALCVVSNVPDGKESSAVKVKMTVNYTDGENPTSKEYSLYDWYYNGTSDSLKASTAANHNRALSSFSSGAVSTIDWSNGSGTNQVIFNQISVDQIDTTRVVKSVDFSLDSSLSSGGEYVTLDVFGITGEVPKDEVEPVSIKTHRKKVDGVIHDTVTWEDSTTRTKDPFCYYIDIWTEDEEGNRTLVDGYNNLQILKSSTEGTNCEIDVTAKLETYPVGTKFHVQMRSSNDGTYVSKNSNTDYIIIDGDGVPKTITCSFPTLNNVANDNKFQVNVGDTVQIKTVVMNDLATPTVCADQKVIWEIPDDYKDWITIDDGVENEGYMLWNLTTKKPFLMDTSRLKAEAHADLTAIDESVYGDSLPNPITPTHSDVKHKQATFSWDNPEIGESEAKNNKFRLQITPTSGQYGKETVVFDDNVDYSSSTQTTKTVTGLSPNTTYYYRARSEYKDSWSSNDDPITSTWSTEGNFQTSFNHAASLTLSPSTSIQLMLGKTDTNKVVTSSVYGSDTPTVLATYQAVTWSASTEAKKYCTVSSATPVQETATKHTFSPTQNLATETAQTWTATVDETTTITATINVTVGVSPLTLGSITKPTPTSFRVNWTTAKRDDDTYWADSYLLVLTNNTTKAKTEITINDVSKNYYDFTNLGEANKSWGISLYAINNNVKSTAATTTYTTPTSYPTSVQATIDGEEIPENTINAIGGSTVTVDTKVIGETFEGTVFDASNQKVTTDKGDEDNLEVVEDSGGGSQHKLKIVGSLNSGTNITAIDLNANEKSRDNKTVSKTLTVKAVPMNAIRANVQTAGLDISWDALSGIKSTDNVQYVIEYSKGSSFNPGTYDSETTSETSVSLSLETNTLYYVRAKYTNNGYSSDYTPVQQWQTQEDITNFGLDKNTMTIIGTGSNDTDTITATLTTSGESQLPISWKVEDEEIATLQSVTEVTTNGETKQTVLVKPHKVGTTYIKAWPQGKTNFTQTCKLTVVKGILEPLVLQVKDITTEEFTLYWNGITDWNGGKVKYKVSVWAEGDHGLKTYILKDSVTWNTYKKVTKKNSNLVNGVTYHCTVHAFNDHFETNEANEVQVRLLDYNKFPLWAIILISTGSAIAGLLILALALYHLWKNSILKTYNKDKLRYTKSGKPKTHDKIFRAMDKVIVAMNIKMMKRSNSLYTRLGTKDEQKAKYKSHYNKK